MMPTVSPCQACGWEFYGFAYAGEACSEECDAILQPSLRQPSDAGDDGEQPDPTPEIFPGTLAALDALTIRKETP